MNSIMRLVAVVSVAAASTACAGAHSRPPRASIRGKPAVSAVASTAQPLPAATVRRLPLGVFYINGGPTDQSWQSLWEATKAGVDTRIVPGPAGEAVNGFAASPAGIVLADEDNGLADELARLTGNGVRWLHPGHDKSTYILGVDVQMADDGVISYASNFDGMKQASHVTIWTKRSWSAPPSLVLRRPGHSALMPMLGPGGRLAIVPDWQPARNGSQIVLVRGHDGRFTKLGTGYREIGYFPVWGPSAPALVIRSSTGASELLYLNGRRQALPEGWTPLCWSPDGTRLLMMSKTDLGIWSLSAPRQVRALGPVNPRILIWHITWLKSAARL